MIAGWGVVVAAEVDHACPHGDDERPDRRHFFFRPDIDSISPDSASFRSLRSMTAGQRNAALAAGAMAFELSDWIDQRFVNTAI